MQGLRSETNQKDHDFERRQSPCRPESTLVWARRLPVFLGVEVHKFLWACSPRGYYGVVQCGPWHPAIGAVGISCGCCLQSAASSTDNSGKPGLH